MLGNGIEKSGSAPATAASAEVAGATVPFPWFFVVVLVMLDVRCLLLLVLFEETICFTFV